jgi:hypothetical protein
MAEVQCIMHEEESTLLKSLIPKRTVQSRACHISMSRRFTFLEAILAAFVMITSLSVVICDFIPQQPHIPTGSLHNITRHHHHDGTKTIPPDAVPKNDIYVKKKSWGPLLDEGKTLISRDGINIAFIGDSLLRYQYLSLVYYLHYDKWPNPKATPSFANEHGYNSWYSFYNITNAALAPYEVCDCWRFGNHIGNWVPNLIKKITENRYYHNKVRNHHVVYIQNFGLLESHGNLNPAAVPAHLDLSVNYTTPLWQSDFADTITNHVALLQPKPEWLFMNEGIWKNAFGNKTYRDRVVNALDTHAIKGIWRTTTFDRKGSLASYLNNVNDNKGGNVDHMMCNYTSIVCMDISWQRDAPEHLYFDLWHGIEPLYRKYNEQLLAILAGLKNH